MDITKKINIKEKIKNIILEELGNSSNNYKIFLFWSRAEGGFRKNSDYDIWILWNKKIDFIKFIKIKRKLDELPYLIDLVDFNDVSQDFKSLALKNIEKWN